MSSDWRERLKEVIKADGRSLRAINSSADGVGENYLQQMLKDEKDPGFSRLSRILTVLGPAATVYVTSGLRLEEPAIIARDRILEVLSRIEGIDQRRIDLAYLALTGQPTPALPKSEQPAADDQSASPTPLRGSLSSSPPVPSRRARQRQRG